MPASETHMDAGNLLIAVLFRGTQYFNQLLFLFIRDKDFCLDNDRFDKQIKGGITSA